MLYGAVAVRDRRHPGPPTPEDLVRRLAIFDPNLASAVQVILPSVWTAQQEHLIRAALEIAPDGRMAAFADIAHRMTAVRSTGLAHAPDPVVEIMLDLVGEPASLLDPNCGLGSIIQTALHRATASRIALQCLAQDINPTAVAFTHVWASLRVLDAHAHGFDLPTVQVRRSEFLLEETFPDAAVDAVVSYPPFAIHDWGRERLGYDPRWSFGLPPRTESELAWAQHAIAHLASDGRAVLLMPPAAANRTAGKRIRTELVRRGALRAVIALPRGMIAGTSVGLHIWVLTRPSRDDEPKPPLFFGEVSLGPEETFSGRLTTEDAASIRQRVAAAWRAFESQPKGFARTESFCTAETIDVLKDSVDLTPHRYVHAEQMADPTQLLVGYRQLTDLLTTLSNGLPQLRIGPQPRTVAASTIELGDLARSEALTIQRPSPRTRDDLSVDFVAAVTAQDVLSGAPPSGRIVQPLGGSTFDFAVRDDDVLISLLGQPVVARVATREQVGAQLGPGVCALRVRPGLLDPWFVAGALTPPGASISERTGTTATGLRVDVKRLRIPVVPFDAQQSLGRLFAQLTLLRDQLQKIAVQGNAIIPELLVAIANGTIESSR